MKYPHLLIILFLLVFTLLSGPLAAENVIHIVGRGETIFSISRFYSVSADELMRINNIADPSRLQAGSRLTIPASNAPALPSSGPAVSGNLADYRVARGDTLYGIARRHGITLQRLLEINGFSPNHALRAGDVIRVPGQSTPSATAQPVRTTTPASAPAVPPAGGIYSLRWPITPRSISYMTGQMGVILEGDALEPVRSLTHGHVVSAGPWRKFGRVVIVETADGYHFMYGGCETLSVSVGDRITPGMEVGRLGVNAVSERAQLFFMVFRGDTPIDPALAPRAGTPRT